jgi:metallophosphoesterase superfamily enzyme
MYRGMEQMQNGEFTGFIVEAEDEQSLINQLKNFSNAENITWYVINEDTKEEFNYNEDEQILERI